MMSCPKCVGVIARAIILANQRDRFSQALFESSQRENALSLQVEDLSARLHVAEASLDEYRRRAAENLGWG